MSEDRTQPPSKRRRQMAREQGQAAHSPELTAAVGWVAAVALLGFFGDDLAVALTGLVRGSLVHPAQLPDDAGPSRAHVRRTHAGVVVAAGGDSGRFRRRCPGCPSASGARVVGHVADCSGPAAALATSRTARVSPLGSSSRPGRWRKGSS